MKFKIPTVLIALIFLAAITATASAPASESQAAVSTAGNVITVKGTAAQSTSPLKLAAGAYVVGRTAGEGFMSITVKDKAGNIVHTTFFNDARGSYLLHVDENVLKQGDLIFEIMGMGAWAVTIVKPDMATAATLPQTLTGPEMTQAVSKPFKAAAGKLTVSYAYKAKPTGTGTLWIVEIATGRSLNPGYMYAGRESGGFEIVIPTAGVYIAQTGFPLGSGGGEVKLGQ
jgi:hypothetical protein